MKQNNYTISIILLFISLVSYAQPNKLSDPELNSRVESLLSKMTLQEKVSMCHANGKFTVNGIDRLGIREMWLSDGPHGVREQINFHNWKPAGWTNDFSTYLPPLTTLAATFNPKMADLHGRVLGLEARDRGKDIILGPGVNILRNPTCGRNFEYMGEDPLLASSIVVPEVIAIQKCGTAACVKHFALNSQELNRHGVNAIPNERTLREIYLPAFKAAVNEGEVYSIMGAYNEFRGTNCCQSKHLVKEILKEEWGFRGVLMTDWNCDINTKSAAVNGLDLEMGTNVKSYDDYFLATPFLNKVKSGEIDEEVLNDKVRRILRLQLAIGMMDSIRVQGVRNTPLHQEIAQRITEEAVVLLKNKDVLPWPSDVKSILVLGPNANRLHGHSGGSSKVKSKYEISPLEGLKRYCGNDIEVKYVNTASSSGNHTIWDEYVVSENTAAGVPAWRFSFYNSLKKRALANVWVGTPNFQFSDLNKMGRTIMISKEIDYCSLKGSVKSPVTATFPLMVKSSGHIKVKINNKEVYNGVSSKEYLPIPYDFIEGDIYDVEIQTNEIKELKVGWDLPKEVDNVDYLSLATKYDAVIYFGGLSHGLDREGEDRPNMTLPNGQDQIIQKLLSVNPNTVVFMIGGSPVEMPWVKQANAIVWGWYGGMHAGDAYARILFGEVNPSGRLPFTIAKKLVDYPGVVMNDYDPMSCEYKEGINVGYRWFLDRKDSVNFWFGQGESYTSFEYDHFRVNQKEDDNIECEFKVSNTGRIDGATVPQIYVRDVKSSVVRPIRELKGFKKVYLNAGEAKCVRLIIPKKDLRFWNEDINEWQFEKGKYEFQLAENVNTVVIKRTIKL
ncbi:glycoside hydrolase family 3 C-terminal domain-containing protein [Halosquirtibacter xylanolyticus]|uniref:beta-glucosidase n=1 Tax=Halosquirtibacter xylanolyticus TaxID=3374599 RepID=UPI00374A7C3C|nr:glycoside hydrolase family 3 C-terminal domain-containing protein [Prolixibacteraceae bacterium]